MPINRPCAFMQHEAEGKLQNIDPLVLTDNGNAVTLRPEWIQYLEVSSTCQQS